jgi:uncharacterized Zn finger protein
MTMTDEPASCPVCGTDDYTCLERDGQGEPDYDGLKRCEECGEVWQ